MCFYERLKKARIEQGLTSKQMAEAIGVAPSSYSQYENGHREPDVFKIKEITKVLNISADYLLGIESKNKKNVLYGRLNDTGQQKVNEYISDLLENPKYTATENKIDTHIKLIADSAECTILYANTNEAKIID